MQRTRFFIDSDRDQWIIHPEGSKRPLRSFRTKREAIAYGRSMARKRGLSQLVVKSRNHVIQTEWTYGRDPERFPGEAGARMIPDHSCTAEERGSAIAALALLVSDDRSA